MFPIRSTRSPSSVVAASPADSRRLAERGDLRLPIPVVLEHLLGRANDGDPESPSMTMRSPFSTTRLIRWQPTTAGMSTARATIDTWLVRPPRSVANPRTLAAIETGGLARGELMADDDHRFLERRESTRGLAHQVVEHPAIEVDDVGGLLGEHLDPEGGESIRHRPELVRDRPFGHHEPFPIRVSMGLEGRIPQESTWELEDLRGLLAELLPGPVAERLQIRDRVVEGGSDPTDLDAT